MPKVNIEQSLWERVRLAAEAVGCSSVDEFIAHCLENELKKLKIDEAEDQVSKQLRGLGYIE